MHARPAARLRLRYLPTAFYQTNPQQTELLYRLAIDGMDLQQGDILMDAYCGSGTIGLCAAKDAQDKGIGIMLLGVERNPAGIADARRNAELNGLTRSAWFMADDATDYILDAADNNERIDVLSIDPPRAGSTPSSSKPPAHSSRAASPISAATL